jgi:hypothetical protein
MGMTVIDPLNESGMGALGDWRYWVLGRAPGNISNEFGVRKKTSVQIILWTFFWLGQSMAASSPSLIDCQPLAPSQFSFYTLLVVLVLAALAVLGLGCNLYTSVWIPNIFLQMCNELIVCTFISFSQSSSG